MPPSVHIDRISISVSGIDGDLGRRLGQAVAQRLAPSLALSGGEASLERLHFELARRPDESMDSLAGRIAAEVAAGVVDPASSEAGQ